MAMVKDPVCGMEIESSQAPAQTIYQDQAYYFCSNECKQTFVENPEEYAGGREPAAQPPLPTISG
jgi:YHS domain-containing protein